MSTCSSLRSFRVEGRDGADRPPHHGIQRKKKPLALIRLGSLVQGVELDGDVPLDHRTSFAGSLVRLALVALVPDGPIPEGGRARGATQEKLGPGSVSLVAPRAVLFVIPTLEKAHSGVELADCLVRFRAVPPCVPICPWLACMALGPDLENREELSPDRLLREPWLLIAPGE